MEHRETNLTEAVQAITCSRGSENMNISLSNIDVQNHMFSSTKTAGSVQSFDGERINSRPVSPKANDVGTQFNEVSRGVFNDPCQSRRSAGGFEQTSNAEFSNRQREPYDGMEYPNTFNSQSAHPPPRGFFNSSRPFGESRCGTFT